MTPPTDFQTLRALEDALRALLPEDPPPDEAPALSVVPARGRAVGIGGLIDVDTAIPGEVTGRRLEATARFAVRGADAAGLDAGVQAVIEALLGQPRAELVRRGILRLALDALGEPIADDPDQPASAASREVSFRLFFEHQLAPDEGEGIISTVPLDLELAANGAG